MPGLSSEQELLIALVTGASVKTFIFWLLSNRHKKRYIGQVSDICLYPVKSAGRLKDLREADLTKFGLEIDGVRDR